MDDQAHEVGRRVRYWRLRRNLDRQRFADMVGRSTSWVDKIEKGERNLLRLPMLDRVADVLSIDPSVLLDSRAARHAAECVDANEVKAIRAALGQYPLVSGRSDNSQHVRLRHVQQQLAYVDNAWLSSHFTVVARHLPGLLADAQVTVLASHEADQIAAHRTLVVAYRLASSMLLKFETTDVAWLAADRAMHAALATDDTIALARATRSVARALTGSGQRMEAIAALTGMADRIRPELAEHEHKLLSLYGMLLLAASIAAAGQDDAALAFTMHQEAELTASRLGPQHDTHRTVFGQANVAVHRVAALVRLYEAGQALEYASRIDPAQIAALPAERKVNYLLDMTAAHGQAGDYRSAVHTLSEAERVAPEEVRCRPLAHGLLRSLLNSTSGESSRIVHQMADRAGVTA